jgi:hypothetical protein
MSLVVAHLLPDSLQQNALRKKGYSRIAMRLIDIDQSRG